MNDKEKERIEKCVVQIECVHNSNNEDIELGTGFFISKNIVITANHVIKNYYDNPSDYFINVIPVKAEITKGIKVKRVIESEINNFISILEIEETVEVIKPLKFTIGYPIKRDDKYFSFGHPECSRLFGHPLENVIATNISINQSRKIDWKLCLNNERVEDFKGFSGSPVIIDNMLVGIVQTESDANGKTISIGMSSADIMKQYIDCEYYEEYIDIRAFDDFESLNFEIDPVEISDVSKIIKEMINIKNTKNKKISKRRKPYTIVEKIQLNNLSGNIIAKIKKHHNESFDVIDEAICCLSEYECCIRDDLYDYYWEIYIDTLSKFEIDSEDIDKIKQHSNNIYLDLAENIKIQLFEGKKTGIPSNKMLTYISAITAYVFYQCKFLIPIENTV
ncbi:serine protease [Clostridium sp.]|uniref:S1 family peptidase n=1 Tax=Clostridium sp. TaxID=1506 RepID=UPI002602B7B7|nr:serine protease [Clostridium sp.]